MFGRKNKPVKTRLEILQERSANAVNVICNTVAQLRTTNDAIVSEHSKNVSRMAKLAQTNESLELLKSDNDRIIAQFENLIS